jgi:hypothetical protein
MKGHNFQVLKSSKITTRKIFGMPFDSLYTECDLLMKKFKAMKNTIYILIIAVFAIFGCEGPVGPAGYDGLDGQDGLDGEEGYTFDYENVDFTDANGYTVSLPFPDNFQMLESDVVLVYLKWDDVDIDGNSYEVWRALPQTILFNNGFLQYNYDFTMLDVELMLDFEEGMILEPIDTDGWVARVVVVPALFGARTNIDYTNYEEVAEHFNLKPIEKEYEFKQRRSAL